MIFLTVGTQLPFDRLTAALDTWCDRTGQGERVFGQIGKLEADSFRPTHFVWQEMLDPEECDRHMRAASLIVSHAGMGSIITAMSTRTPIVVLPRRADLGEQRNDHQMATARRLGSRSGLFVAAAEDEVPDLIERALSGKDAGGTLSPYAEERLLDVVRGFIQNDAMPCDPMTKADMWGASTKA